MSVTTEKIAPWQKESTLCEGWTFLFLEATSHQTLTALMQTSPMDGHLKRSTFGRRKIATCPRLVIRVVGGILSKPTWNNTRQMCCKKQRTTEILIVCSEFMPVRTKQEIGREKRMKALSQTNNNSPEAFGMPRETGRCPGLSTGAHNLFSGETLWLVDRPVVQFVQCHGYFSQPLNSSWSQVTPSNLNILSRVLISLPDIYELFWKKPEHGCLPLSHRHWGIYGQNSFEECTKYRSAGKTRSNSVFFVMLCWIWEH